MLREYFSVKAAGSSFFIALLVFMTFPAFAHEGEDHTTPTTTKTTSHLQTTFEVTQTGSSDWKNTTSNKDGDEVTWRFSYKNTGNLALNSVVVKASLPTEYKIVAGGVQWFDANHPNGYAFSEEGVERQGVSLGNLPVGANGYLRIRSKVTVPAAKCNTKGTASGVVTYDNHQNAHSINYAYVCAAKSIPQTSTSPTINTAAPTPTSRSVVAAGTVQGVASAKTALPATGPREATTFVLWLSVFIAGVVYKRKRILTNKQK